MAKIKMNRKDRTKPSKEVKPHTKYNATLFMERIVGFEQMAEQKTEFGRKSEIKFLTEEMEKIRVVYTPVSGLTVYLCEYEYKGARLGGGDNYHKGIVITARDDGRIKHEILIGVTDICKVEESYDVPLGA